MYPQSQVIIIESTLSVAAEAFGMPEELLGQLMSPDLLRAKDVRC